MVCQPEKAFIIEDIKETWKFNFSWQTCRHISSFPNWRWLSSAYQFVTHPIRQNLNRLYILSFEQSMPLGRYFKPFEYLEICHDRKEAVFTFCQCIYIYLVELVNNLLKNAHMDVELSILGVTCQHVSATGGFMLLACKRPACKKTFMSPQLTGHGLHRIRL